MGIFFLYLGVFFTSASLLVFEILSTRISRIAFGADYKFVTLSMAVLGVGLGGLLTYYLLSKFKNSINSLIIKAAFLYSLIIISPFLIAPFNNVLEINLLKAGFFLTSLVIYVLAGVLLSLAFVYKTEKAAVVYFWDLAGAATGISAAVVFLNILGNEKTIIALAFLSIISLVFFNLYFSYQKIYPIIFSVLAILLILSSPIIAPFFTVGCAGNTPDYSYSNSFSLAESYHISPKQSVIPNPSDKNLKIPPSIETIRIEIDCYGLTHLVNYDNIDDASFTTKELASLPYKLKPSIKDVLIIGSGAGIDVVRALQFPIKNITAVEINPSVIDLYKLQVRDSSDVYSDRRVNLVVDEGRRFVETTRKKYDLIVLPFSFRYGRAGLNYYAYIENYLFTKDAFGSYLKKLKEDGILAVVIKDKGVTPRLGTSIAALKEKELDPEGKMAFIESDKNSILLIKNNNFSFKELSVLERIASRSGYPSPIIPDNDFIKTTELGKNTSSDELPYLIERKENVLNSFIKGQNLDSFLLTLRTSFAIALSIFILAVLYLIFSPGRNWRSGIKNKLLVIIYFSATGAGFMIFELALIQRFGLFLSNPYYSMATILAGILFFGGIGSVISSYLHFEMMRKNIILITLSAVTIILIYIFSLSFLFTFFFRLDLTLRVIISLLIISIPSALLGMLFPLGIKLIPERHKDLIPAIWGLDGISAVWGGVAGTITYASFGFKYVLALSIFFYLIVLTCAWRMAKIKS